MLGEKTPKKGLGTGTPQGDTFEETVKTDMTSAPAGATFDARAAYAERVDKEAFRSVACRDGSSGEPWIQRPRSGIWTMVDPSMGEAKSGLREELEIQGVYSHFQGIESGGSMQLGGVIASDIGGAIRIKDFRDVKIPKQSSAHSGCSPTPGGMMAINAPRMERPGNTPLGHRSCREGPGGWRVPDIRAARRPQQRNW